MIEQLSAFCNGFYCVIKGEAWCWRPAEGWVKIGTPELSEQVEPEFDAYTFVSARKGKWCTYRPTNFSDGIHGLVVETEPTKDAFRIQARGGPIVITYSSITESNFFVDKLDCPHDWRNGDVYDESNYDPFGDDDGSSMGTRRCNWCDKVEPLP